MRVTGRLLLGDDAVPFAGAVATVIVEDTTYADAPAVPLASWRSNDVTYPRDRDGVPFDLDVQPDPADNVRCTLRALVDVDRDGSAGPGDYVSVESIRVTRRSGPVVLRVKRLDR